MVAARTPHECCLRDPVSRECRTDRNSSELGLSSFLHFGQTFRINRCAMSRHDARRDQERLNTDIDQTCDGAGRIVRMQRTENQVSSQRCLNRDVCSLFISDFPDENDIRAPAAASLG